MVDHIKWSCSPPGIDQLLPTHDLKRLFISELPLWMFISISNLFLPILGGKVCKNLMGRVYESAHRDGTNIPQGKYYLADADFRLVRSSLIPLP